MKRFCKREGCENRFEAWPYRVEAGYGLYCSRKCMGIDYKKYDLPEKLISDIQNAYKTLDNNTYAALAKRFEVPKRVVVRCIDLLLLNRKIG